jgi:outer membrane protein assembly factor BamA
MPALNKSLQIMMLVGVLGSTARSQTDSRIADIAAQQDQKAALAKADEPNKIERSMLWFRDQALLQQFSDGRAGLRAKIGGLGAGTGFGLGPEFRKTGLLGGELDFRASAQTSFRGDRRFELDLLAPKISGTHYFAEFYAVHHNYSHISYYGSGPESSKSGRTNFQFEDTAMDATFGVRPLRHLILGSSAGYVFNNVGPGSDSRYASSESVYSPADAPGIDVQSDFLRTGAFVQYDWRDNPGGPRRGGNYIAQFSDYRDRSFGISGFRRLDLEVQQFVPVLNARRVFAFRARSALTYSDNPVPFYMQPSLGGSEDLRGYRPYRFRGENMLAMNAEYRWEVFSGLDMAVFADAGKVSSHKADLIARDLETSLGFGLRFNARNKTFLRLDVGFSHEGFQVWVKFNELFKRNPVYTSSSLGGY